MARSVDDAAVLYDVVAGHHPGDWASVDGERLDDAARRSLKGLRVGVVPSPGDAPVAAAVIAGVERAAESAARAGAEVVELTLPWNLSAITAAAFAQYGTIMAPYIRGELGDAYSRAMPYTREFVETSEAMLAEHGVLGAVSAAAELHASLAAVFERVDVLILPSVVVPGLDAETDPGREVTVEGVGHPLVHHLQIPLTIPFNLASRSPVFAVPTGAFAEGMPISVQVAGPPYAEQLTAALAGAVERGAGLYADAATRPTLTHGLV